MSRTPDQLTQEYYKQKGWHITKVESWTLYPQPRRKDFLHIFDYLAFRDSGEIAAIQTTTKANFLARRKKMLSHKSFSYWTQGGRKSILQGWYKKSGVWVVQEEELTMDHWHEWQAKEKEKNSVIDTTTPFYKELFPDG